jgi:Tol biopolymer transport system component
MTAESIPVSVMRRKKLIILAFAVLCILPVTQLYGQFYNGMQMTFGKNRVQYKDFYWTYFRFEDIDCYYNEFGHEVAEYASKVAHEKLNEIEDYFDYTLDKRLILIIYNKKNDFRQSNIGLISAEDDYNVGGYSRVIKNKVMLWFNGDHEGFSKLIASAIAEVVVYEMLYNADLRDRVTSNSQIQIPDWYIKGLVNYVAFGWDSETDNRVRDGFENGRYKNLDNLEYEDAVFAGQSFWKYIGKTYGDAIIPNIIYLSKIYKNIEDGFLYGLGKSIKDTYRGWRNYYADYYHLKPGEDYQEPEEIKRSKPNERYTSVKISPDGRMIAWVSNNWGKRRIWLYDTATGKSKKIFSAEPKYEQSVDYSYPVMTWHPGGQILTFVNEEKGGIQLYFYRTDKKKFEQRALPLFEKVLSLSYSPDGTQLVMSAVMNGMTDIYLHTIISGTSERITYDVADDIDPSFIRGRDETIIFSSNRLTDTLTNRGDPQERVGLTYNLFTCDLKTGNNNLTRLDAGTLYDYKDPIGATTGSTGLLANDNGITNYYYASIDSAIAYIDTTLHYRYFIEPQQVTNFPRNLEAFDRNGGHDATVIFDRGRYRLLAGLTEATATAKSEQIKSTEWRAEETASLRAADSINRIRDWLLAERARMNDTLKKPLYEYYATNEPIDFRNYVFEKEKENFYELQWRKDYMDIDLDTSRMPMPEARLYRTSFYNNYTATQIDFNFLNNTYQAYNGGAPYFNPGLNMLFKIGTLDLFEDYRITGGFRFSGNFDSNEYLVSLEALKGKFDKQVIFHKQSFDSYNDTSYYKIKSYTTYLSLRKPLSTVLSLKGTLTYRFDNYVIQSTDQASLIAPSFNRHWVGLKGEVIYDNTRKRTINIYYGTRFKVFGEYYREVTEKNRDMFVFGTDFRHYLKIHRDLIWANRFAASTSFGPSRLIYYLGGVDNWMGFLFNKVPMFDQSVPVDPSVNYGFQALATNMRGFTQNIRNGSNFALINSEIRWPVIRYFAGHPLRSNFLNSIQLIAFGDMGMAWSGWNPWGNENYWNNKIYKNGPVVVTLDAMRNPLVAGFGGGARAQIFGYFVRADLAWGIDNGYILPKIFYLSFSLDF